MSCDCQRSHKIFYVVAVRKHAPMWMADIFVIVKVVDVIWLWHSSLVLFLHHATSHLVSIYY